MARSHTVSPNPASPTLKTGNPERTRLEDAGAAWKTWGPYLSDRSWGTVREDMSETGNAWRSFPHDHARSRAFRWGEDGIAGISDLDQLLCFSLGLWNGHDPILKERLFGLDNGEGNHGEDVKECYFYTDCTPTHSLMRMTYQYPHAAFPYDHLVATNAKRSKLEPEYELVDTGIFNDQRYFSVEVAYAKASPEDIAITVTVANRGPEAAAIHLLPTLWYRNTWSWGPDRQVGTGAKPHMRSLGNGVIHAEHELLGGWQLDCDAGPDGKIPELLFCDNDSNRQRLWQQPNLSAHPKDSINAHVVNGVTGAVNPQQVGTKAAAHYRVDVPARGSVTIRLRLRRAARTPAFTDHAQLFATRQAEAEAFYAELHPAGISEDYKLIQRQAWAGMLWSKQWFAYDVPAWSRQQGEDGTSNARLLRNQNWHHFSAADIMSMPDKWEYPWFAAWDLAFHCIALAYVDSEFAKQQLLLLVSHRFQGANGAVPAYEWNFDDCNPPVIARAVRRVFHIDRLRTGREDRAFLDTMFQRLGTYYVWWLNRKDATGSNLFQGGFLGLDNIGVFDRSKPLPTGGHIEQSDGTAWMGVFCLDMALIGLELTSYQDGHAEMTIGYLEHFLYLGVAMNNIGGNITGNGVDLWDAKDGFFYDVLRVNGQKIPLKVRSLVGLIPLFASGVWPKGAFTELKMLQRLAPVLATRPRLREAIAALMEVPEHDGVAIGSLVGKNKFEALLRRMLDEKEFLSPHGIRGLSKYHEKDPYTFFVGQTNYSVRYVPGDSDTFLFGGNSNWCGPVWMPVNYLLVTTLKRWYLHLGPDYLVEFPTGSGVRMHLGAVADALALRLISLLAKDTQGRRPALGTNELFQNDPHWQGLLPFHEYFHGDNGTGLGASHQTGWTGLIAVLIQEIGESDSILQAVTKK